MTALLIGYARVSTDAKDLTAQREGLLTLGVDPGRLYVDHGLTGTNREHPGLREALAACREGDTLVVTKLDRLARSLPDARAIAEELTVRQVRQVRLSLGGSVYDPNDPVGRLLFNVLAMVAEFESDLIRPRTKEGMRVAKAKGRLRGKQPSSTPARRPTWWTSIGRASTAPPNWPTYSVSPAPPSTAPCNETNSKAWPGGAPPQTEPAREIERRRSPGRSGSQTAAEHPGHFEPVLPCDPSEVRLLRHRRSLRCRVETVTGVIA
jgi:hypothetical protein